MADRYLAVVTGASTGIGLELARLAAADDCDLIVAADEAEIEDAALSLRKHGGDVRAIRTDLGTGHGVAALWEAIGDRSVDYMMANAGRGLGDAFLDQDWDRIEEVIHLNVTGTTAVVQRAARGMAARGQGRILITGSLAGNLPGSYQAVYNATKAYVDTLSWGIRNELADSGVTVTCLLPGPVETEFFHRADMDDTPVGQSDSKADPARVARQGYEAMKRGASGISPTFMTRVQNALSGIVPDSVLARMHRGMAEPEERPNG
jgi:uncharacterized protein